MQRFDPDFDFDGEPYMQLSATGDYVRHSDALAYAEEQARKARREALEEAVDEVEYYGNTETVNAIRALMDSDTRRDGE